MKYVVVVVFGLLFAPAISAQNADSTWLSEEGKTEFWQEAGWIWNEGTKVTDGMMQIEALIPVEGAKALTAENFDPNTFDPTQFQLELDESKHTYIQVGDRGAIFMYSKDRFDVLWNRQKLNQAAAAKK